MTNQTAQGSPTAVASDIFSIVLSDDWTLRINIATIPLVAALIMLLVVFVAWRLWSSRRFSSFEIDGAEVGIGDFKLAFKPNDTDRQIAYAIWVELSTRKLGLNIDLENDVIVEVYDSWYHFFGVTRELVKAVPVSKVRHDSTKQIIKLSIEVLNEGLRPHLNKWQARYRRWYAQQIEVDLDKSPQEIQKEFPEYDTLCTDLLAVNKRLVRYREKMNELVTDH
ncbi:MAG: hypothetical protein AAGB04_30260 [Pseudomonadota bacterium]